MDYKDLQASQAKENFWFEAKNDLIRILMNKASRNKKDLRILNIGAGTGNDLKVISSFGDSYVVDIDTKALSLIDDALCAEKKLADACNLPYSDSFFDAVVSFDVFEHIENDRKAINEAYRVLKKGGILVFTVPAFQFLFSSHDKVLCHQRRYNKKSIKALLSPFNNHEIFFWNSFLFAPAAILRILKKKSKPKVDQMNLPLCMNTLLYKLTSIDNFLIERNISMPIGLSIVGFCRK